MQVEKKAGRKSSSITIIGSRLKDVLKKKNLRQQDLANSIVVNDIKGVSLSTINRAINNNRMEISILYAVFDFLGVGIEYLIGAENMTDREFVYKAVFVGADATIERTGELIRCKNCYWHYGTLCRNNNTMPWEDEDFCSNAERKEE